MLPVTSGTGRVQAQHATANAWGPNWDKYFHGFLIPWEGSKYENVPGDPGGPTKFGIDHASHPGVDIANLTEDQAELIDWQEYFKDQSSRLPWPMDCAFFDMAMNTGESPAVKAVQRAVGAPVDGVFGPQTEQYAANYIASRGPLALLDVMIKWREDYYNGLGKLPDYHQFLAGWLNRSEALRKWATAQLAQKGAA